MSDFNMPDDVTPDAGQPIPSPQIGLLTSNTTAPQTATNMYEASITDPLSVDLQNSVLKSIKDIFETEEEPPKEDEKMDDDDEDEPMIDLEDQQRRTEKLNGVLPNIVQLWLSGSETIDVIAEELGDGSRDPKWRKPLGKSGILNFFLDILSRFSLMRYTLKIHVLRIIGNSCADTDENRERLVASNHLPSIIVQLHDTSLLPFVIPVLYNICIDYEPAQQQACACFLTKELIELASSPRFNESRAFLGYVCKLLDLMVAQPSELDFAPDNTPIVLLGIATERGNHTDMDDFISLVNTAVAYLQHEKFQKTLIARGAVDVTLSVLVESYTRFDSHPSIGLSSSEQDDAKAISQMRSNLNQVLSDISALPEFKEAYPVVSHLTSSLRRWLLSPQLQLQVCACIMLGNLARSDASSEEFVHTSQVHLPLISLLREANDSQLLHAAIGFLKNLALPLKNKEALGNAGLFEVLPRLWALDTLPQIQFSSISLARQLTIGTFENVRNVCQRLSDDEYSPANGHTKLSLLIALFDRTDSEPIKMEIARLITSVCRVFNTYKGRTPEQMEKIRIKFFTLHQDVGGPLSFMVSQKKWPVVRSEGWFVFALMARFPEGAKCISDLLHQAAVFEPLLELLSGKNIIDYNPIAQTPNPDSSTATSPDPTPSGSDVSQPQSVQPDAQATEMARIDRENALVLVSELLKNRGNDMAVLRRAVFEDLLKGGTEILASSQEAKERLGEVQPGRNRLSRAGLTFNDVAAQSFSELL